MDNYERIAGVIRYLDAHHGDQPELTALARGVGLSESHFHRLFSRWAGVTPKDFVQCLTLAHAKALLRKGESVFNASLGAGLSGPGRLHDLCVSLESASPGELKSGGAGWTILYGVAETPFGKSLIAEGPRGVCHVSFVDTQASIPPTKLLHFDWPQARLRRDDAMAANLVGRIFCTAGAATQTRPLRALVRGTAFQLRVWRALLQIPPGTVLSYKQLATTLGRPNAARAVGTAIGQNPLGYLIPCHRVIRDTGVVGKYHWGTERKKAILAWESCPRRRDEDEAVSHWPFAHE